MSFARPRPRGFGLDAADRARLRVRPRGRFRGRPQAAPHRSRPRLREAIIVWWRATELDRQLAAGDDPRASDALALRARRLTTARNRRHLADGLAGALRTAGNHRHGFTATVDPRSDELLDAAAVIASIERRLRGPSPVAAQSVALVRLLLIDGNGPLYRPSNDAGALATRLRAAAATLNAPSAGD